MAPAVALFFSLATQWRWIAGMGGALRTGLDYNAVHATATGIGVDMTPTVFNDIRVLERAALDAWNKK